MRAGRKPKKKVTLATTHIRLAADVPMSAGMLLREVEVADPYDNGKILVFKSLRDDPLGRYHAHRQIDDAQYSAGRAWQNDYEASEIGGVGAVDTTKEPVDGGSFPELLTEHQQKAMRRLAADARQLGMEGESIVRDVLGQRWFMEQVAAARGFSSRMYIEYFSKRFRECLETIAKERGFVMKGPKY